MPTLGEELKRRREERRITLADISEATRIGTRFLKAIEADNYSILPGGIFTRSFIRAYAKQVGLNEDEAVARYQQQVTGQAAEAQPPSPPQPHPQSEQVVRQITPVEKPARKPEPITYRQSAATRTSWPTIIIGAGILVFVGLIVWALVQKFGSHTTEQAAASQPPPQVEQTTPDQPAQPASPEQPPEGQQQQPAAVAAGEPLVVRLEAAGGDSSVQYWIDEAPKPVTVTVKNGQAQDLTAQNQIRFNIGNRPVLKLKINNRDAIFPPDTPKWGAKVTISRDNLQSYIQ